MMTRFVSLMLLFFSSPVYAQNIDFERHVIVILDNSGVVYPGVGTSEFDQFYETRRRLIDQIATTYRREDFVTVLPVARPRVIWNGSASLIDRPRSNKTLTQFLGTEIGGCSDYAKVWKRIDQQIKRQRGLPVVEVVFLAAMIQMTPDCKYDADNADPPQEILDGLAALVDGTGTKLRFLWVDELTYDTVQDFFFDKNIDADIKQIEETILELDR